ncbi:MAG: antitoxin [Actinobacteria bacterium]|nr:antitoxin [Actinomycetota bacterium]
MTTLYVRDVPTEVAATLKERAAAAGMSLSAYVAAELTRMAERPTNAEIVERLRRLDRSQGPSSSDIVDVLGQSRR